MKKIFVNIFISISVALFFNACTSTTEPEIETFVFPYPPEIPRYIHLKTIRGESDFAVKKEESFLESIAGLGTQLTSNDFIKPYGITGFKDKIYVTDTGAQVVFIIDTKDQKVKVVGNGNEGKLSIPVGVAIDNRENIYVTDSKAQRVFGYDKNGKLFFVLGNDNEFIRPTGIAINRELEMMYIVDTKGHTIRVFSLEGDFLFDIGERGSEDLEFNFPTNIAIDQETGNIVVVDTQNFRVQIMDQDGNHIKTFGNVGDVPGTFARPKGVAIDSEGNIYISDSAFDNIQIFDRTGEHLLLYFGETGTKPGTFNMPAGLFIDSDDRLHVTENFSGKVQILQYLSEKWKQSNKEDFKLLMDSRKIEE